MPSVLMVSKPIAPPWNDSGKNLVRDLARSLSRFDASVMTLSNVAPDAGRARAVPVYGAGAAGFAPSLSDQARVFGHLLSARGYDLWHFFFAPNPKSCLAGGAVKRLRNKRTVHTVSSAPRDADKVVRLLFADVNVVLSHHTEARLRAAGVPPGRLLRIPPAIELLAPPTAGERAEARELLELPQGVPLVLYPGDLEFGAGAELTVQAFAKLRAKDARLVVACRAKTPGAHAKKAALVDQLGALGLLARTTLLGETPHIHRLLGCVDVAVLPAVDLYAKMDYPLVLLEAMALATPVVVAEGSAAAELSPDGALAVAPQAEALARELDGLLLDAGARAALAERGRRCVSERFGLSTMAEAYEQLYERLL